VSSFAYRRIVQSSAVYGAGIVTARFASFALLPVYTRYLATSDYGTLELLDTTLFVVGLLLGGRFADALYYHYSLAESAAQKRRVLSTVTLGAWLIGMGGAACGWLLAPFISRLVFQDPSYARYFQIVFLSFGLGIPVEVGFARLRAMDRPVLYVTASLVRLCLTLALTIYLVVFLGMKVDGVLYSNLTATVLLAGALTAASVWSSGIGFCAAVFLKTLRFAVPLGIAGIGLFLIHFGDRFFLQRYASLGEIGIYALAYKLGMLVSQIQLAFGTYWGAQGYQILRSPEGPQVFARVNTYLMAAVVWGGLAIVSFTPPVVALMAAPPYAAAVQYVPWIVLAYVLRVEADYFRFTLYLDAATGTDAALVWIGAAVCTLGYAFLIPSFKLWGAVASTLAAFVVLTAAARWVSVRRRPFPLEHSRLIHLALTAAPLAALSLWIQPAKSWQSWATAVMITLAFPLLLLISGFVGPDEKAALTSLLQEVRRKFGTDPARGSLS